MFKQRVLTGLTLVISLFILLIYTSPQIFKISVLLICQIAIYELLKMYKFSLYTIILTIITNISIIVLINNSSYDFSQILRIISVITWGFLIPFILIYRPCQFYKPIIFIFSLILFIPTYYGMSFLLDNFGKIQLVSILAIAWVADTGAYGFGKLFGKHKLYPQVSPGKSIEGALGGLVMVLVYLFCLQYFQLVNYLPSYITLVKFGLILSIVSIIGDLFESWLKRVAQVKDSGTILPGHGGIFDRIDSLIAVVAISYAILLGNGT